MFRVESVWIKMDRHDFDTIVYDQRAWQQPYCGGWA